MEKQDKQSRVKEMGCGVEGGRQGAPGKPGPGTRAEREACGVSVGTRHLGLGQREGQVTQ